MSLHTDLHLDPDEKIILEVRKHWIVFLDDIIVSSFFAVFPIVFYNLIFIIAKKDIFSSFVPSLTFVSNFVNTHIHGVISLYTIWLLFIWINFFINWTKYYLNVWYITDQRVIDIEQKRIFHRTISNIRFDRIQDISVETPGFLATFFKFGNIKVQTASDTEDDFIMETADNPEHIRKVIFESHNNHRNDISHDHHL